LASRLLSIYCADCVARGLVARGEVGDAIDASGGIAVSAVRYGRPADCDCVFGDVARAGTGERQISVRT
jgi:hypothetical protein